MWKRDLARLVVGVAVTLMAAGLVSTVAVVAPAGAIGGSGSIVPGATVPQSPFTANTPFASGQNVDIAIPANSVLPPAINLQIVECSAPLGVLPTNDTTCDGETIQGASIHPNADGSVDLNTQTHSLFTMYALPDLPQLGESSSPATCDLNDGCVLYIGDDYTNFTAPHFFSPVFYVAPNGTDSGTPAGDGSLPTVTSVVPNSGTTDGGTSVTITGFDFTGVTGVDFGSVAASSFTVDSTTQITATTPAEAAGTVDTTVTTGGGTSGTGSSDHFTFVPPAPAVSGVSPPSGSTHRRHLGHHHRHRLHRGQRRPLRGHRRGQLHRQLGHPDHRLDGTRPRPARSTFGSPPAGAPRPPTRPMTSSPT